tara:strand:- start:117 stop:563 length:447 start_codon:yes stop_codon:yes gene_type:complete
MTLMTWLKKVSRDKTSIAPLSRSKIYRAVTREKCLDVLLSLEVNAVAFFETIEDANVAKEIAYFMTRTMHFDTEENHYYFRTSHQRGKERGCVLAIQRISEKSGNLSQNGRIKRRCYRRHGWSTIPTPPRYSNATTTGNTGTSIVWKW